MGPYWHPIETWLQTVAEPTVTPENWQEWVSLGARAAARHRRDVCRLALLRRDGETIRAALRVRAARARAQVLLRRALRRGLLPSDRLAREGLVSLGRGPPRRRVLELARTGHARSRRHRRASPDRSSAHLRPRDRLERRRPRRRLRARSDDHRPHRSSARGRSHHLGAAAQRRLGRCAGAPRRARGGRRLDPARRPLRLRPGRPPVRAAVELVQRSARLLPRRCVRLLRVADRADGRCDGRRDRLRILGRPRADARVPRA